MNVLMLNYEYPPIGGGGANVSRDISEKMVDAGHQVTVITMWMKGLKRRENVNGVDVHRVVGWRKNAKVCYPWEQMIYCFSAFYHICKEINLDSFDVIHCHFIVPTGLVGLLLKIFYKKDYVLTAQGSDVIGHNNKRFKHLYSIIKPFWIKIVDNARAVTAPSQYLIDKIHTTICWKECVLIPNGLNIANYRGAAKSKTIITLSRLQESKGIQDLLYALSEVDIQDWKVYVIGDGPYKKELSEIIRRLGLNDKVTLTGFISDEERYKYLSEAGVYFTGSWFEAMPVSLLEAMASSCNIIASNIEPHRDILSNKYIYTTKEDLKMKLKTVCNQQPYTVKYAIEKYDLDMIVAQYRSVYQGLGANDVDGMV